MSERRDGKTHLGAVGRFVCGWVEMCAAKYQQTGITCQKHPVSIQKTPVNISKQTSHSLKALTSSNLFWFSKISAAGLLVF